MTRRVADAIDMGRASCGGVGNNFFEVARLADKGDEVAPIIVIESI